MKIAFYKAKQGRIADKVISFVTNSPYSHCELVDSNGICASSSMMDGGVRFARIDLGEKWDVFSFLPGMFSEQAVFNWFIKNETKTYDYVGAIASGFGFDLSSKNKKYCSQACAEALGLYSCITPGELYELLTSTNTIS